MALVLRISDSEFSAPYCDIDIISFLPRLRDMGKKGQKEETQDGEEGFEMVSSVYNMAIELMNSAVLTCRRPVKHNACQNCSMDGGDVP